MARGRRLSRPARPEARPCARLGSLIAQKPPKRRISSAVEQRFCKPKVGGSIPSSGTKSYSAAIHDRPERRFYTMSSAGNPVSMRTTLSVAIQKNCW